MRNTWSHFTGAIITLVSWMAVAEAAAYLLLPDTLVARFIGTFNTAFWYIVGGLVAMAVGLYLVGFGFTWW
jgi:hypothetical protein